MQFEEDLEQLIYRYHEEDENITLLKKAWGKKGTFIKDIPDVLHEQLIPKKSVAEEEMLLNDSEQRCII